RHLAYTVDGVGFASGADDREVIEWDSRSPNPIGSISSHCGGGASALGYLAEGHLVVGHRDNNLRVFDARTKKALATYHVYENPIRSLSLHRSGQFVATACPEDQCVSIIDLLNGAPLTTFTIKMPVKQALFLSPCDPPVNDFDTSDLLCVPGRGKKLNIFNCDLTHLLDDEDRTRASSQNSECIARDVESCPGQLNISQSASEKTAGSTHQRRPSAGDTIVNERDAKPRSGDGAGGLASGEEGNRWPNGAPVVKLAEPESGVEMMARRVGRMTLARRTIKPKRISLDDLDALQEKEALQTIAERPPTGNHESGAVNGTASMGRIVSQIADLTQRMDRLESMVSSRLSAIDRRLLALEERGIRNNN
ncbi:POC1 centriolar proteinA-like, partial [Tropilaelaps mercedesae]